MAVQKTIRQFQTTGIVGDIVLSGPVRAQAGVLNTSTATYNVIGSAMTHVSGQNGQFTIGGTGVFAGILANSKQYGLYGTSAGTLEPGKRTGKFRLGKDDLIVDENGNSHISVEDYAVAMVDELENPKHHYERFTIGY